MCNIINLSFTYIRKRKLSPNHICIVYIGGWVRVWGWPPFLSGMEAVQPLLVERQKSLSETLLRLQCQDQNSSMPNWCSAHLQSNGVLACCRCAHWSSLCQWAGLLCHAFPKNWETFWRGLSGIGEIKQMLQIPFFEWNEKSNSQKKTKIKKN